MWWCVPKSVTICPPYFPQNHISCPFSECYGGFPSAYRRPNYHQFRCSAFCTQWQAKCLPCLSSPPLLLSLSVFVHISLSDPFCLRACHSLILQPPLPLPPLDTHIHVRGKWEAGGGKLQDSVYFSRIIEICLDANGISCLPKCLNISQTQTCTQKFACEFKQKAFGRDDAWGVYAVLTHLPLARVCIRRGRLSSTLAHMANLDVSLSPPRRWSCGLPAHTRPSWRSCLLASRFISRPL